MENEKLLALALSIKYAHTPTLLKFLRDVLPAKEVPIALEDIIYEAPKLCLEKIREKSYVDNRTRRIIAGYLLENDYHLQNPKIAAEEIPSASK